MSRARWHILREGESLTVTRALQALRGFAPVVQVTRRNGACEVVAGGRVDGMHHKLRVEERIAEMLADPACRARWSAFAAHLEVAHA